jgi:hypothetical protein
MMLNLDISSVEQKVAWMFFFIEIGLVTILMVESFAAKIWLSIRNVNKRQQAQHLINYFKAKNFDTPPPYLKKIDLILLELNKTILLSDEEKKSFVKKYVLTSTRPFIETANFIKRYYLIESYNYYVGPEDLANIIELIKDKHHIISLNALQLSHMLVDAGVYKAIINKLAELDWTTQKLYIAQLPKNEVLLDVLIDVLKNNMGNHESNRLRALCYDIAHHCGSRQDFYQFAEVDAGCAHIECQLAAIRILAESDPAKAKNKLFSLLKHNNWLVRNSAIQALGQINVPESIDRLAQCLNDENYWVRVNSTKALLNIGDEGKTLVTEYLASNEARFQQLASYFLDIKKMKEQL